MVFVVNFTDSNGQQKNRVIPGDDKSVVFQYFKDGRRYDDCKIHKIWSAQQFADEMEQYVGSCAVPQRLGDVGHYANPPMSSTGIGQ